MSSAKMAAIVSKGRWVKNYMTASRHENALRFTWPMWGESVVRWWIPLKEERVICIFDAFLILAWRIFWTKSRSIKWCHYPLYYFHGTSFVWNYVYKMGNGIGARGQSTTPNTTRTTSHNTSNVPPDYGLSYPMTDVFYSNCCI